MDFDIESFEAVIASFHERLRKVPEEMTAIKPGQDKWSLKEIVGHLIDSASNNHQRFVRRQLESALSLPGYAQEDWVRVQKYNDMNWGDLVRLWRLANTLLLHIIRGMDRHCRGNIFHSPDGPVTLGELVNDYFRHMQGHVQHFEERYAELLS